MAESVATTEINRPHPPVEKGGEFFESLHRSSFFTGFTKFFTGKWESGLKKAKLQALDILFHVADGVSEAFIFCHGFGGDDDIFSDIAQREPDFLLAIGIGAGGIEIVETCFQEGVHHPAGLGDVHAVLGHGQAHHTEAEVLLDLGKKFVHL